MKQCTKCGEVKELKDFHFIPCKEKYRPSCRSCIKVYRDAYHIKNADAVRKKSREYHIKNPTKAREAMLKRLYGIDGKKYNEMLTKQDNKCKICYVDASSLVKKLEVDHNHMTGKIRGLLCPKCNKALGLLKVDLDLTLINNTIKYLGENHE